MALIGHFVAADSGNVGLTLFDRSSLGNDATILLGLNVTGWEDLYDGCPGVLAQPSGLPLAGAYAPDLAEYTLGDFVMIVCATVAGSPSEFYGAASHSQGGGVTRKWVLGFEVPDVTNTSPPSRSCFHLSDGSTFDTLTSDPWPKALVQLGSGAPGGGDNMEGVYAVGLKRVGNDFTWFFKWGVFRQSTGECIDQVTGDPATVDAAVINGTSSSAIVPGNISASLCIGNGGENAFGVDSKTSWFVLYDDDGGLPSDDAILALLDAAFPSCGTELVPPPPPVNPTVALPALCVGPLAPAACPQPEEA